MKIFRIVSPINGIIRTIDKDTITIYISPKEEHTIYAPISGELIDIEDCNIKRSPMRNISRTTRYCRKMCQYMDK